MRNNSNYYSNKLHEDGFVHVDSLFNSTELEDVIKAIKDNMDSPSPFGKTMKSDKGGEFFMDFNNWKRIESIKNICFNSKMIDFITTITNSKNCWLFHDHVLVKSGAASSTPIHHDRPYYIFDGNLNLSVWITADNISRESSLVFYKGSHKSNKLFVPRAFGSGKSITKQNTEGFSVIDEDNFKDYEEVDFEMKAGDAIVFFHKTVHRSKENKLGTLRRALSVRYLLDGTTITNAYINATPPFDRMGVKINEGDPVPENFFPLLKS